MCNVQTMKLYSSFCPSFNNSSSSASSKVKARFSRELHNLEEDARLSGPTRMSSRSRHLHFVDGTSDPSLAYIAENRILELSKHDHHFQMIYESPREESSYMKQPKHDIQEGFEFQACIPQFKGVNYFSSKKCQNDLRRLKALKIQTATQDYDAYSQDLGVFQCILGKERTEEDMALVHRSYVEMENQSSFKQFLLMSSEAQLQKTNGYMKSKRSSLLTRSKDKVTNDGHSLLIYLYKQSFFYYQENNCNQQKQQYMHQGVWTVDQLLSRQSELTSEQLSKDLLVSILSFFDGFPAEKMNSEKQALNLMKILSSTFFTQPKYRKRIKALYQKYTNELSLSGHEESNNFAILLYNMKAQMTLELTGEVSKAKGFLKKINRYIKQKVGCDPTLLSLSLNNLAVFYFQEERYEKAFMYALKAYENIKSHLHILKKKKDPSHSQKVVVFVNSCYLLTEGLRRRLKIESPSQDVANEYLEYTQIFYSEGHRKALKYLGRDSYLLRLLERNHIEPAAKNFTKDLVWKHELPVLVSTERDAEEKLLGDLVEHLNERLNPRLDSLLDTIVRNQQLRKTVVPPPPPPPPEPKYDPDELALQMTKHFPFTKKCSIKVIMFKGKKKFRFGKILLEIHQNDTVKAKQEINEEMVLLLLEQTNRDCAAFDLNVNTCSPQEFMENFIFPFINFEEGTVSINPRARGLLDEKIVKFLDLDCLTFINHVKANEFRLSICPLQMVETLYVNIVVSEYIIDLLLKDDNWSIIVDPDIQNMLNVVRGENQPTTQSCPIIQIQSEFSNLHLLEEELPLILNGLSKFLGDYKLIPAKIQDLFRPKNNYCLLKYKIEEFKGKGCYYSIRNVDKDKCLEIIIQNEHESMGPSGKIRARGYHSIDYQSLQEDMAIEDFSKYQYWEVLEVLLMISQMFHLHTYEEELEKDEKELYCQNAIRVAKLVSRVFKREYRLGEPHKFAMTATVVTISSEVPLGIKVTLFEPQSLIETGFFLRLDKRRWLKEKPPRAVKDMLRMSKVSTRSSSSSSIFNRNKKEEPPALLNYLFNPILTAAGLKILFDLLCFDQNTKSYVLANSKGARSGESWRTCQSYKMLREC